MGKLVRDKIPELIRANGDHPQVRVLDDREFRSALLDKLVEEAEESQRAAPDHLLEELADLYEVLVATCAAHGWRLEDVTALAARKSVQRGAFRERLFLE